MAHDDHELVDRRRSRDLLRRAHELSGIGSFVIDLNRHTIHMSAELAHLFRAGDDAIELPLDAYHRRFSADDIEPLGTRAEAAREREEALELESRVTRGDGEIIWARIAGTIGTSADGDPLMVGVVQDITRSKRDLLVREAQIQKLERIAERLTLATDAAAIGTWDWDVVTGRMRWDATMFALYGIRREDFAGTLEAWMSMVCPADRDRVVTCVQAAVASDNGWVDELSICRPDGSLRVIKSAARIIRDAAGAVVRMVGVNCDATKQRRAEESLVASEALLLQLVRHTPAAVAMFDREMRYLQTSDRWINDYHLVGRDLFGRSHYEVFPEMPERWKDIHQRALAGAVERCGEDPFPRADGTIDWLEWEIQPWRTATGEIGGVILFSQVITERIRAEERLRESEARFRQIAETIGEVFWVRDPVRDEFLYVSPSFEKVWGRPVDDLTAKAWPPAVHVDDRARVTAAVRALSTDGAYDETYRIERPDGVVRWIRDRAFPVRGAAGEVYRIVGTASDITAQRDLEAQLRQAQKMEAIGVLAGGVAHDFNNLLAVILSYSSLLLEDVTDGHPMRADLHEIKLAGERAAQLTRQLLAFSRQQVLQPRVVDLNEAVAGTEKMLRRLIGEDIDLVTSFSAGPARTFIDPGQFEQVLMNLAVNARDAMPDGGRLGIDVARREVSEAAAAPPGAKPGWFVVLTVADSGVGMDAATQSRIFEPFFTTKAVGKGTGLGLSTVFGIVEQSGGHIEVHSSLDNGTTFRIWLPLAAAAINRRPNVTIVPEECAPATVLVVEDEDAVRKLASRILTGHGFRVLEARSAVDALLLFEQHPEPIDLVLTDVVMPGMSGDQLAVQLRARRPGILVAFMSGYPDRSMGGRAAAREIYIAKPFTPAALLKPIVEALARPELAG